MLSLTKGGITMATETLGAHLRNLLTPYKTLLSLVEDINNGEIELDMLKKTTVITLKNS